MNGIKIKQYTTQKMFPAAHVVYNFIYPNIIAMISVNTMEHKCALQRYNIEPMLSSIRRAHDLKCTQVITTDNKMRQTIAQIESFIINRIRDSCARQQ